MALVILAPSLSWPLFVVTCLATVIGLVAMAKDGRQRRLVVAGMFAFTLAWTVSSAEAVPTSICSWAWWALECWLF